MWLKISMRALTRDQLQWLSRSRAQRSEFFKALKWWQCLRRLQNQTSHLIFRGLESGLDWSTNSQTAGEETKGSLVEHVAKGYTNTTCYILDALGNVGFKAQVGGHLFMETAWLWEHQVMGPMGPSVIREPILPCHKGYQYKVLAHMHGTESHFSSK